MWGSHFPKFGPIWALTKTLCLSLAADSLVAGFTGVKEQLDRNMGRLMGIVTGSKATAAASQEAALQQAAVLHQAFKQQLEGTQFNQLKSLQQGAAKVGHMVSGWPCYGDVKTGDMCCCKGPGVPSFCWLGRGAHFFSGHFGHVCAQTKISPPLQESMCKQGV
jgi:hypothetical protein